MLRLAPVVLALGIAAIPSGTPAAEPPKEPAKVEKNAWLNPSLLASGYNLLRDRVGTLNLAINPSFDFRPVFVTPRLSLFNIEKVEINLGLAGREREEVKERIGREANGILKDQLGIQKKQLDVQIAQLEASREQNKQLARMNDQMAQIFEYQKEKDRALLRRDKYTFPANKLVVVVADFSSGGTSEGVEVADEIGSALYELRKTYGIDVEVLVGEVKPGVVIRNEQMARDLGQHFPLGTAYAVIWGTLSPRTVGKFRPHVTCVIKVDDAQGYSRSYTIDPESQDLPAGDSAESARRKQHEQLVGFACALVPGCYASYHLSNDRRPDLKKYLEFLAGSPETARIAAEYREQLPKLEDWIKYHDKHPHLRRLSPVDDRVPLPHLVLNTRDNSRMVLVTEPGGDRPRWFPDSRGEYALYIDETETTLRQVCAFLQAKGNEDEGGAPWLKLAGLPIEFDPATRKAVVVDAKKNLEAPAFHVSYWGARQYCAWAGKQLPLVDEWRAAAEAAKKGKYPWGDEVGDLKWRCANKHNSDGPLRIHRVGSFSGSDRSAVGCLDMAGNLSEWCEDPTRIGATRAVCGGNVGDEKAERFETTAITELAPPTHHGWVGFRGTIRIYKEK